MLFILKGMDHFTSDVIQQAAKAQIPMPYLLVPISGILAILGGLSIMLGYKGKLGAWLLILFLLSSAFAMHRYWEVKDFTHAMMHELCFWKNLSLAGGALIITYFGTGPLSLSRR